MISTKQLANHTADGAFTVNASLRILSWNDTAASLFGVSAQEAIGQACYEVIAGHGANGELICHRRCEPLQCAVAGRLHPGYELRSRTAAGDPIWLQVSLLVDPGTRNQGPQILHVVRPIDRQKQLEAFVQYAVAEGGRHLTTAASPEPAAAEAVDRLSERERDVLRLYRHGRTTAEVATNLGISRATVRTHTQNILDKLGVHSKVAAVVIAERHAL